MVIVFTTRLVIMDFNTTQKTDRQLLHRELAMIYGIIRLTDQEMGKRIKRIADAVTQPIETATNRKHGNEKKAMEHSNMFYSG